jgi:cytochrome c
VVRERCRCAGPPPRQAAKNNVGPTLNGLIGRKAGSVAAANKDSGITWDEATFREYIKSPKAKIPARKMIYAGLTSRRPAYARPTISGT